MLLFSLMAYDDTCKFQRKNFFPPLKKSNQSLSRKTDLLTQAPGRPVWYLNVISQHATNVVTLISGKGACIWMEEVEGWRLGRTAIIDLYRIRGKQTESWATFPASAYQLQADLPCQFFKNIV